MCQHRQNLEATDNQTVKQIQLNIENERNNSKGKQTQQHNLKQNKTNQNMTTPSKTEQNKTRQTKDQMVSLLRPLGKCLGPLQTPAGSWTSAGPGALEQPRHKGVEQGLVSRLGEPLRFQKGF